MCVRNVWVVSNSLLCVLLFLSPALLFLTGLRNQPWLLRLLIWLLCCFHNNPFTVELLSPTTALCGFSTTCCMTAHGLFPPPLLSLSLCLSVCVAPLQSLLVPGKSPSKYGRRGSAIGIGTIEEVHVKLSLFSPSIASTAWPTLIRCTTIALYRQTPDLRKNSME